MGFLKGLKTKIFSTLSGIGGIVTLLQDGFQGSDAGPMWVIVTAVAAVWAGREALADIQSKQKLQIGTAPNAIAPDKQDAASKKMEDR